MTLNYLNSLQYLLQNNPSAVLKSKQMIIPDIENLQSLHIFHTEGNDYAPFIKTSASVCLLYNQKCVREVKFCIYTQLEHMVMVTNQ